MMCIVLLATLLAACGGDEDVDPVDDETIAPATEISDSTGTEAADDLEDATESGVTSSSTPENAGTPFVIASPAASPVAIDGSTVASASPAMASSPAVLASPAATPQAQDATPVGNDMLGVSGTVILPGDVNEAYVLTDTGCVGLGAYSDIRTGRQLVVRDESATIIGVTTLEASDVTDSCQWTFALDVAQSEYYVVSIPMVFEYIVTADDLNEQGGEISLPLR
jgi:hypothetical protein